MLTRGNVFVGHLYNGTKTNRHYYYHKGWNLQAVFAYICGIAPPFPGFVGTLGAKVSTQALDLGRLGWLLSFTVSFVVYYVVCSIWPTNNQKMIKEMQPGWEANSGDIILAPDGTEIVEEGAAVRARSEGSDDLEAVREEFGAEKKA